MATYEGRWLNPRVFVVAGRRLWLGRSQQLARQRQASLAAAVGQQPVVADAMEAAGQHVKQEAAQTASGEQPLLAGTAGSQSAPAAAIRPATDWTADLRCDELNVSTRRRLLTT
jgi:hypothetical protein